MYKTAEGLLQTIYPLQKLRAQLSGKQLTQLLRYSAIHSMLAMKLYA